MPTLYLIRHGQASAHSAMTSLAEQDYDHISPLGARQAYATGLHLADRTVPGQSLRIRHGPLSRHIDSARYVASGFNENTDASHQITSFSKPNGGWSEYPLQALQKHLNSDYDATPAQRISTALASWVASGDKTFTNFRASVLLALSDTIVDCSKGSNLAVITSGGPIALAVIHSLGLPSSCWPKLVTSIPNGSITSFSVRNDQVKLRSFNEFGHLDQVTSDGTKPLLSYL